VKNLNTQSILEKLAEERVVIAAILITIILLITASSVSKGDGPVDSDYLVQTEFSQMMELDLGSSISAAVFRLLMLVFLTLAVSGIALNIQGLAGRNLRYFPAYTPPEVRWGLWPVLKIVIYFICIVLLSQRLESVCFSIFGIFRTRISHQLIIGNAFWQFSLMIFLVICFLTKYRYSKQFSPAKSAAVLSPGSIIIDTPPEKRITPMELLGISLKWWGISFRQALRGYILFFPVLIVLILISQVGTKLFGLPFQPHPLVQPLLETGNNSLIWPLFAIGILLGPLAEELFFRGLLFPALKSKVSVFWAVSISAALFATLHLNWAGWLPIFGLGILLAYSYEKTGSLLVPIFIHVIHNSLFLTFTALMFWLRTG
jgi:membrane protease YdiL (CAAX protease family)